MAVDRPDGVEDAEHRQQVREVGEVFRAREQDRDLVVVFVHRSAGLPPTRVPFADTTWPLASTSVPDGV